MIVTVIAHMCRVGVRGVVARSGAAAATTGSGQDATVWVLADHSQIKHACRAEVKLKLIQGGIGVK